MATISDITNAAQYRGTPYLGGSIGTGITIDPSPLQRLATFTYYRDRDFWLKKQRDDAIAAERIAQIAAYDTRSPFKQYTDDLTREVNELYDKFINDPSIVTYDRNNPQKWLDFEQQRGRIENKRKRATGNDALYNADKARVEQIVDPVERDLERRKLEERANDLFVDGVENAYNKQFEGSAPIKKEDYDIPSMALTTSSFIIEQPNKDFIVEVTHGDPADLMAKARLLVASGTDEDITKQDWFIRLSPARQKLALEENALKTSERRALQRLSLQYKSVLEQWKAANPTIDLNTVDVTTLPDGIMEDNIRSVKLVNQQIGELNSYILEGRVKDKAGRVKTTPYAKINFADGLDEAELIVMQSLQKNKNALITKVEKKIQGNDDDLERRRIALGWANADSGPVSKDAIENPAIQFGGHINRVKTFFQDNPSSGGMIVRFSGLDEDTKKALGLYKEDAEGNLEAVELKGNNSYVTYFNDGTYRVGTNNKGDGGNPGTLETLRQGYINTVKSGLNKQGVQSEGFQKNAEDGFKKIFGANNSKAIWESWRGGQTIQPQPEANYYNDQNNVQSQSGNRITYKDGTVWEIKGNKLNKVK